MSLHLANDGADHVEAVTIAVEGIEDPAQVTHIEKAVRRVMGGARLTGKWAVEITPSDLRGRWDVGVKGPGTRHVFSFVASTDQVSRVIEAHMKRAIEHLRSAS